MIEITYYLQIDKNNDMILTRDPAVTEYNSEAEFSWDDASKLDFQVPADTKITFRMGNSMSNWFFRNGPKQTKGYPKEKGIYFADGVKKGNPRSKRQGSFLFMNQTSKEIAIQFDNSDIKNPKGKNPAGYFKYEMYLVNKQINNKGEIAEVLVTIDPGGGKGDEPAFP